MNLAPDKVAAITRLGEVYEAAKDLLHNITPALPEEHSSKNKLYGSLQELRDIGAEAIRTADPSDKLQKAKGFLYAAIGELNFIDSDTEKCSINIPEGFYQKVYGYAYWENLSPIERNSMRNQVWSKINEFLNGLN